MESLRVFEACARHASYSRAADELGVSPAAVSQRMRDLQADLGAQLFDRRGPRVTPTERAARLASRIEEALGIVATAVDACREQGAIRVSAAPTFASRWLAPRLPAFGRAHGQIGVVIDASVDLRARGSFDLAVRSGLGPWPGYAAHRLFEVEATPLYDPARYRGPVLRAPRDLLDQHLIHSDQWVAWFARAGVQLKQEDLFCSGEQYPSQDLAAASALEGNGVALISPRLFASHIGEGRLVRPFDAALQGPEAYWLIIAEGETRPDVLRMRDWMLDECKA